MYKTQKKVKIKRSQGKNEVLAKVIKHNGIVVKGNIGRKIVENLLMS